MSDETNTYGEDIHLTTIDSSTIYTELITALEKGAGEPLYPGDERRIYGEALVAVFVALYNKLDDVGRQTLLRYARGVKRLEGDTAKTVMRFSLSTPRETNIIIPKWTKVTPDGENYFATDEIAVLQAGTYSVEIPTSAVGNGVKFNGYAAGTITTLVDLIPYIESVTNLTETAGGDDGEPYTEAGDNRLQTDYAKIFDGYGSNNKNSNEVVFALYNSRDENKTGGFSTYFAFSDGAIDPNAQATVPTNTTVQYLDYGDEYLELLHKSQTENNDSRVRTNLGEGPYGRENRAVVTWPNKFIGNADSSPMIRDCDILYYRYALAVMLDAELKYYRRDYAGALASLNIIAKRAYGKENFYTSATQGDVLKALCNEYLLEFPCEGVVWWALIRLDRIWEYNADLKARKDAANILLWPISKSARDKNSNLAQTEGWY